MRVFKQRHGHTRVRQDYVTPDGYRLGSKVNIARSRGTVPDHIRQALDDLGMIWDTRDLHWQSLYSACLAYREKHGDLDVSADYVDIGGFRLGARLKAVRQRWREGTLPDNEERSLAELGLSFTFSADRAWEEFLAACDGYRARHGSIADVRKDYVDEKGYRLGAAVSYYRNLHNGTKGNGVPEQRRAALDERGMVWRLAPSRDITPAEADTLHGLGGPELGHAIVTLIDNAGITQSSIATALGVHRSYLNTKIKNYRANGTWSQRNAPQR
jgi:hypothetical protein